jgi:branched-chain amino acid transport system permease protein
MLKKIERFPLLILLLVSSGFVLYGYGTSLLKITDFIVFCIFVLSFDLLYGHMGRLSFGHMLYLGSGAYGAALCAKYLSGDPFVAILCGILLGGVVGAVLGPVVVRTTGAWFALLNLALNELGYFLVLVPMA